MWVFAAAHLAGTGLEYYGCGAVGPVAVEVLRSTEAAFFCLLRCDTWEIERRISGGFCGAGIGYLQYGRRVGPGTCT